MRARTEVAVGGALLLLLALFALGEAGRMDPDGRLDARRTTYRPTPAGARAWTDGLERLGVRVERARRPIDARHDPAGTGALYAFIDPSTPIDLLEAVALLQRVRSGEDLLLTGRNARLAIRCFGWDLVPSPAQRLVASGSVGQETLRIADIGMTLRSLSEVVTDSSRQADLGVVTCAAPKVVAVDTLLKVPSGRPVAVRLNTIKGGRLLLVADGDLFADTTLRQTDAGVFALALVAGRYDRVVVDEVHHGYGISGGMGMAILKWSSGSPWGWLMWQLIGVGVLAILVAAVRSGPLLVSTERQRRSPLDHVRALAHALASARGHDVAVRLLIGGLRRRLSADGRPDRGDPLPWLADLGDRMRTPRGKSAARALQDLTRQPPSPLGVLAAANAVEEVWDETRP